MGMDESRSVFIPSFIEKGKKEQDINDNSTVWVSVLGSNNNVQIISKFSPKESPNSNEMKSI